MADLDNDVTVALTISAYGLPKVNTNGSLNPYAVLIMINNETQEEEEMGITDVLYDTSSPQFSTIFIVKYLFEILQEFRIRIYDYDPSYPINLYSKHHFLGEVSFNLSNVMCSSILTVSKELPIRTTTLSKVSSRVIIKGVVLTHSRDQFRVTFSAVKLSNKAGVFGTSSPYLTVYRNNDDGIMVKVWQSEVVEHNLNPKWHEAKIPMSTLCSGDLDKEIKIELWDLSADGSSLAMGSASTTVKAMLSNPELLIDIIKEHKVGIGSYKNSGSLKISGACIEENYQFGDYLKDGCEISLVVAIDFTASNGDYHSSTSLHYIDPEDKSLNQYQQAITAVGKVLAPYDSDDSYPVIGFGARLPIPDGKFTEVQHCFPVSTSGMAVKGISGILSAYKDCVQAVKMGGPTYFEPIIKTVADWAAEDAASTSEKQKYTILLILTDGVINDFERTKKKIIEASSLPLSIIIIGVGEADFSEMEHLDSDNQLLTHDGSTALRDIVQFVKFKDLMTKGPAFISAEVLCEIPTQLLTYMKEAKLAPVSRITTKSDTNADNHNAFDKVGDLPNDSDLVVENNSIDVEFFNEETSMEKIEE